jgi:hypothetical protein
MVNFISPIGLPMGQGIIHRNNATTPPGYFLMVDSAFFLSNPPATDITLIYIGGDTVHIWTDSEIAAATQRTPLLWPCWVRSNPGQVSASGDASACVSRLRQLGVPSGTNVILDLEIAVDTGYVNTFNATLNTAGYQTCKYGSQGFIFQNPQTSGGTFVAAPGISGPITIGDTVATQFDFAGSFDLSWVNESVNLWEAGSMAITNADAAKIAAAVGTSVVDPTTGATVNGVLRRADKALPVAADNLSTLVQGQTAAQSALSAIRATLIQITTEVGQQLDPASIATAIVSQLAADGFTAEAIAAGILAGLPPDLANQVVAAMAAALTTP